MCGLGEEEGQRAFHVCRGLDSSAGLSIEGERQDFIEIENRMVVAFLLGGGGGGAVPGGGWQSEGINLQL